MGVRILTLKIATRKSKLALIQTEIVIDLIKEKQGLECEKLLIETEGDRRLDVSLDKIGGKGVFVKDIEQALIDGTAHAAVHSMKDVPHQIDQELQIAAIPVREDVRDVFISTGGISFFDLPKGAKVATSSKRRSAQIMSLRPDIEIIPVRGNVLTRIEKIKKENIHGIVLAAAGIKRLNLEGLIRDYFNPWDFVPAVGQGAIGVEILKSSQYASVFRKLDDEAVRLTVEAERSFMRKLNGGCSVAIGAFASIEGEQMNIIGIFQVGDSLIKKDITGSKFNNIRLGELLAEKILNIY